MHQTSDPNSMIPARHRSALHPFRGDIIEWRRKGYSWRQISLLLQPRGVNRHENSVREWFYRSGKAEKPITSVTSDQARKQSGLDIMTRLLGNLSADPMGIKSTNSLKGN